MTLQPKQILDALRGVRYPGMEEDIVASGMVGDDIRIDGRKVSFSIHFPKARDPFAKSVVRASESTLEALFGEAIDVRGRVQAHFPEPKPQTVRPILPGVQNVLAISSGKGGVGKSTVTANLAVALARQGYRVGLLDADVYGPSMPKMFRCEEARPVLTDVEGQELIEPVVRHGVKLLSMGFFVDPANPVIWRGTLASNALKQLITQGNWGTLDFLLVDLPPGTSDIHITMIQTLGITGAIVVTTPQEIAVIDARKGVNMFREEQVNVPILGIVENMSYFTPEELPDNKYYIFGRGGGRTLAEEADTVLLAEIPLVQSVCEGGDAGRPIALLEGSLLAQKFDELASQVVYRVYERNENLPPTRRVEVK